MFCSSKHYIYICGVNLHKNHKTAKKMSKKIDLSNDVQPTLKALEVGERAIFDISRIDYVCSVASRLNVQLQRIYKTQRYVNLGYVQVIRTA